MVIIDFILKIKDSFLKRVLSGVSFAKYKGISVGDNCRIYTKLFGTEPWLISIGNNVTITRGVIFLTHDGSTWLMKDVKGRRFLYKRIFIGNNVMIGVNSIILPGVRIEDNVIIGAGSVVTKSIPSGFIVAGNPAKIIGKYHDYEKFALNCFVSFADLDFNLSYKERIIKVVTEESKEFLTN